MTAALLSVSGLRSGYGGSLVLDGLDLEVAEGEVLALLGRNGMGKTTLLRTLMGLLRPSGGEIRFAGVAIAGRAPFEIARLGLAYVPQGRGLFAALTVEENLRLGALGKAVRSVPDGLYALFPVLAERRRQAAGTLSGGQQQQLAIARALAGRPRLLLLDEPSEGIQPSIVAELAATLAAVAAAERLSVLLVEQNVEMVLETAGRCAFLEDGRIAAEVDAHRLAREPALLARYLSI